MSKMTLHTKVKALEISDLIFFFFDSHEAPTSLSVTGQVRTQVYQ